MKKLPNQYRPNGFCSLGLFALTLARQFLQNHFYMPSVLFFFACFNVKCDQQQQKWWLAFVSFYDEDFTNQQPTKATTGSFEGKKSEERDFFCCKFVRICRSR